MATVAHSWQLPGHRAISFGSASDFTVLALSETHESGDSSAVGCTQGIARSRVALRKTSLRWPSQEPTKVATIAQLATTKETRGEVSCGSS